MNKKDLSERDICTKFISPAVKLAGWDEMTQVREEVGFTNGRILVLDDRTKLVAAKVSGFLRESGNRFQKTIVFCVDEEHAARMRQALINENKDLCDENHRYVMRITGSDTEGQAELSNFIDPEAKYPVLVTISRLLSTGVDAQTCRLIVLDRAVGSMTEFKQVIGRGTRVHEDTKKFYFTLIDFRGATNHFADPDFDGEPVQIYEPGDDDPITPPDDVPPTGDSEEPIPPQPGDDEVIVDGALPDITIKPDGEKRRKIYVDGVAGGAHLASCAMCAGLGATIPGCLASSPGPMQNLTPHQAKTPDSMRHRFTLHPQTMSFCRMSEFRIYR